MIAGYRRKAFAWAIPGLLLLAALYVYISTHSPPSASAVNLALLIKIVGTILVIIGLSFYAKAKGRHPAWGLVGMLSFIGLIVLLLLKDLAAEQQPLTKPTDCA